MDISTIAIRFEPAREFEDHEALHRAYEQVNKLVGPVCEQLDGQDSPFYALTDNTCRRLAQLLPDLRGSRIAKLQSSRIDIRLPAHEADKAEWFILAPQTEMVIQGGRDPGLIEIRADRIKGTCPLRAYSEHVFVSEAFVGFAKAQKLTGLEFIWCPDKGKFAAPQWYRPIATTPIGRGIDHPWFDPSTRGQYKEDDYIEVQPTDGEWLIGVCSFSADQLRDGLKTSPASLADLLRELKATTSRYGNSIHTPPTVLRDFLPSTDFAYLRVAAPQEILAFALKTLRLCCSAVARQTLIAAGHGTAADFTALVVVNAAPKGIPVFDRKDQPIGRTPAPEQLTEIRKAESIALAKFAANPKPPMPVKAPAIAKLIPSLKKLLKSQGIRIATGASMTDLAAAEKALGYPLPGRWKELLSKIDGFQIDNCNALDGAPMLHVASAKDLVQEHERCRDMIEIGWPDLPKTHLGVARNDGSDAIFLDTTTVTPDGDCPVIYVDHEECQVVASWPSIGVFISEAVTVDSD